MVTSYNEGGVRHGIDSQSTHPINRQSINNQSTINQSINQSKTLLTHSIYLSMFSNRRTFLGDIISSPLEPFFKPLYNMNAVDYHVGAVGHLLSLQTLPSHGHAFSGLFPGRFVVPRSTVCLRQNGGVIIIYMGEPSLESTLLD